MTSTSVQQMADRVAELMGEHLRVKGQSLSDKLRRGRRKLPRNVQVQATFLAEAARWADDPRLRVQLDMEKVAEAYDICCRHLVGLNRWERRRAVVMNFLGQIAFIVLVVSALVVGVLVWRGFL